MNVPIQNTVASTGPMGGIQELVLVFLMLSIFALWLWSLVHCIQNKALTDTNRIIGVVLIVVLGPLGSLIYLFLPRDA